MYHTKIVPKIRRSGILHGVMLELTYKCNLDCFFCFNDRKLQGQQLVLEDYERLLDDLREMEVLNVTLTGGEPMLHPDFFAIGKAAADRGFLIRIKSGGHAIAGKVARRIRDEINPFQVQVSLHGAYAETHEKQTQVPGSFNRLIGNIKYMKEIGLRPTFISTLTLWNQDETNEMYALADSLGVRLSYQGPVGARDDGDTEPLKIQPSNQAWEQLKQIQEQRLESGIQRYDVFEPLEVSPTEESQDSDMYCGLGTEDVLIDPYGSVYPCLHMRRSAGNLHQQGIKDIWGGGDTSLFSEARAINRDAAKRKKQNSELGVYDTPMFCPGMELRGCGSGESSCGSGCGSSKNVNQTLQEIGLPSVRSI